MPLIDWLAEMNTAARRRLLVSNLLHDAKEGRLDKAVIQRLLAILDQAWSEANGKRPDLLVEELADKDCAHFICQGPRIRTAAGPPRYSRIVDDKTLALRNLDPSVTGLWHTDEIPPHVLKRLERRIPRGAAINMMRGGRPFAWVTKSADLDALREEIGDPAALATAVRNRLGLIHHGEDQLLIEIAYPAAVAEHLEIVSPTVLEGGCCIVYRSIVSDDAWGRTVNLETNAAGLPEAVHAPVPFSDDYQIRVIGRVADPPPPLKWEAVVRACPHCWSGLADEITVLVDAAGTA